MIATEFGFVFFHQYPKPAFAKYLLFFKYPYLKLPFFAWKNNSEYNLNVEFKKWMPNYWERVKLILCFCMQVHLFIAIHILRIGYELWKQRFARTAHFSKRLVKNYPLFLWNKIVRTDFTQFLFIPSSTFLIHSSLLVYYLKFYRMAS